MSGVERCVVLRRFAIASFSLVLAAAPVRADEGMWTFDNFPSARVAHTYGFTPSSALLDHVRSSSVRIAEGCSASFVSPQGLVMTNHHCVVGCVGQLSTPQQNFVTTGFLARTLAEERTCPDFELDRLDRIEDVTPTVRAAIGSKTGDAANAALRAADAQLEKSCDTDDTTLCQVVSLYHGGVYDLYHYKKFTDVRLVFAPEYAVAQFGGDSDNFNFPRYDFDVGMLRAYENGKPAATPQYLRWSANGSKADDLVFVAGNPGQTDRELTVAQLDYERRYFYPAVVPELGQIRGMLGEFARRGPEQAREAHEALFYTENSYKAFVGEQGALEDPVFFAQKVDAERTLRAEVAADPKLEAQAGGAWDDIAKIQPIRVRIDLEQRALGGVFRPQLMGYARTLVRAAAERTKPNGDRLPEFTDQRLATVEQGLIAAVPVYDDLEETLLAFGLSYARQTLGTDAPLVRDLLGDESPEVLARRLVTGTRLGDPKIREALYKGGQAAIDASTDPMIVYAKRVDPAARALRTRGETLVTAPTRAAAEKIANARFAILGTSVDPDATFTLRLSYGKVAGFTAEGKAVPPYTTMAGLFARATPYAPYALPASWLAAKPHLDLATPMNLATTNDIIGGNSGSPLVNESGDIVGLIFDGNIYSLGGAFAFDPAVNRSVAVDSRALLSGLDTVYHARRIVEEIEAARR